MLLSNVFRWVLLSQRFIISKMNWDHLVLSLLILIIFIFFLFIDNVWLFSILCTESQVWEGWPWQMSLSLLIYWVPCHLLIHLNTIVDVFIVKWELSYTSLIGMSGISLIDLRNLQSPCFTCSGKLMKACMRCGSEHLHVVHYQYAPWSVLFLSLLFLLWDINHGHFLMLLGSHLCIVSLSFEIVSGPLEATVACDVDYNLFCANLSLGVSAVHLIIIGYNWAKVLLLIV